MSGTAPSRLDEPGTERELGGPTGFAPPASRTVIMGGMYVHGRPYLRDVRHTGIYISHSPPSLASSASLSIPPSLPSPPSSPSPPGSPREHRAFAPTAETVPFSMLTLEGDAQPATETTEDALICIICTENLRNVVLLPCGHMIYCVECARNEALSRACAICRTPYSSASVVFRS
jgi:hypothetical protein